MTVSESNNNMETESLFEKISVAEAINKAQQKQTLLIICVQGKNEDDELLEQDLWRDDIVKHLTGECICLRFWDDSEEATQFKQFYSVPCTPTIYFIGLQRKTLQSHSGKISVDEFVDKYGLAREALSKQITDIQQQLAQFLLLQQLQQHTQATSPTQSTASREPQPPTTSQQPIQKPAQQPNTTPLIKKTSNISTNNNNNSSITTANKTTKTPTKTNATEKSTKLKEAKIVSKNSTLDKSPSPTPQRTVCSLVIRLTNGQVLKGAPFSPSDTLIDVRQYIDSNRTDGLHKYVLMTTHPKRVFSENDNDSTLAKLDLVPSATLVLVSLDPNTKPIPAPVAAPNNSTQSHTTAPSNSESEGILTSVSNYVWSWFGSGNKPTQQDSRESSSMWEHKYNPKLEQAVRSSATSTNTNTTNTKPGDQSTEQSGIRNRGQNRGSNVHRLHDDKPSDEDKDNAYWNGNSTQFK